MLKHIVWVVKDWHWRVKAATLLTVCYALLWGVRFVPPHAALFFWQRGAWSLAIVLVVPVFLTVTYLLAMVPFPRDELRILLVLLGLVVLGCNLSFGLTLADWLGISVKPAERCEVFASDENGLRVTLYRETLTHTFVYGEQSRPDWSFTFTDNQAHIFLENTTDGGNTWTQTAYYTDQAPDVEDFCEYIQSVGDTFFVVVGEIVMTSLDHGAPWYEHKLSGTSAGVGYFSGSHEYRIVDVGFTDPKHGSMTFTWHENTFDYGYHEGEITLATNDGGQTWNLTDSASEVR